MTQTALADVLSASKASVSQWENDDSVPEPHKLMRLPGALGVSADWLYSEDADAPLIQKLPLLTRVSAGRLETSRPIELWEEFPSVTAIGLPPGRWIAFQVEGDSMNQIAADGALIFVNRDDTNLVSGQNYVFVTDDGEAAFKRFRSNPDRFEPASFSPGHDTIFPQGSVRVIGRAGRVQADL